MGIFGNCHSVSFQVRSSKFSSLNFVRLLNTLSRSSFATLVIIHLNCMHVVGLHLVTIFNALKWKQVELFASATTNTSKDLMFLFRIQLPDWLCFYNIGLSRLYGS